MLFPLFNVTSSIHPSITTARGESTRARVRDRKCGYYYWHWTELDEGTFLGYAGPYPDIPLDTPLFVPLRTIKC